MKKLENKVAVVTGGNSGIGFATSKEFIAEGAQVIITGRNEKAVQEAVQKLGGGAHGIASNAGKMSDIAILNEKVARISPKIDTLFINAGVFRAEPFDGLSEETFDYNMDINLKGAFFTIQKLIPILNDGGSITIVASILAHEGFMGSTAYSASKAGLISLGKTLAVELASRTIRVNIISPGQISTPIYEKTGMAPDALQGLVQQILPKIPFGRFGEPEEIAKAALFLASDDSRFITGSEIVIDGGKLAAF